MEAILWRDYLCPWCHLGRDRSALLTNLGVTVRPQAYELHPEIPLEGRAVRPDGRLARVLDHIAMECAAVGLAFRVPTRIANTRAALEISEVVRADDPDAFPAVDNAFYDAQWVHDLDLGDPMVIDHALRDAGLDPAPISRAVDRGDGGRALARSMAEAREHDVTGTPAWWVDDRLLVPGVQDPDTLERWIRRLQDRPKQDVGGR